MARGVGGVACVTHAEHAVESIGGGAGAMRDNMDCISGRLRLRRQPLPAVLLENGAAAG
jgi:hypothetical protein